MRIAMIGTGYVGLVSGACLARLGHTVTCVDIDAEKIAGLRDGRMPIFEPGLAELVAAEGAAGRLAFSTELARAVANAEVVFIAVGTPSVEGGGEADLRYVYSAAEAVGRAVSGFTLVVVKSTVPVGTGDRVEQIVRTVNPAADVAVVSNPEFLREGVAIADFMAPDRIVIGIEDERARAPMTALYAPLAGAVPVMFTARRTSELIKYAANAFLAMKVTFINEIADLCEAAGTNVEDVARGIGLDSRIGPKFLNAGPGFGGSCFPKDTFALLETGREFRRPLRLIETTVSINEARKVAMSRKVIAACGGSVEGRTIAVLGLTFKANTDDMRESASLTIIRQLQAAGARVVAFDPQGMQNAAALLPGLVLAPDSYAAAAGAAAAVIVTDWNEFRSLDLDRLRRALASPVLVDLRNLYEREAVEAHGLVYESIGRPRGVSRPA